MVHHASHRRLIAVPPSGSDARPEQRGTAFRRIHARHAHPPVTPPRRARSTSRPRRSTCSSSSQMPAERADKAALQESLWPDTFVVEANLSNLVAEIRAALEDDVRHPRFIRTVHGYGMRSAERSATIPSRRHLARGVALRARTKRTVCILWQKGKTCSGREGDAASWFDSTSVSRRHARIVVTDGKALLEDIREQERNVSRRVRVRAPVALETARKSAWVAAGNVPLDVAKPSTETQFR